MAIAHAPALLARLRVCQSLGKPAPPELVAQLIQALSTEVRARGLLASRNALIRRAGLLLPGSNPSTQAATLLAEARRMRPTALVTVEGDSPATVRECLAVAATYGKLPTSHRHYLRILLEVADK